MEGWIRVRIMRKDDQPDRYIRFAGLFSIPESLIRYIPRLFSGEEIEAALSNPENRYSAGLYSESWLEKEYCRGFLNKTEEEGVYCLNNLYGMLDVFVVSRKEEYDSLFSMEEKHEIDDWYFDTYYSRLVPDEQGRLTEDKVMPLEEVLEAIREDPRQIYLNYCDCRSLTGDCGKPTRTCLTYKNGPNTFVDRGLSQPLTKEEAMEIVRNADKNGLMHTTMSGGLCNCCSDCCYLFRSQKRAGLYGIWPSAKWIVSYDAVQCISCGLCVKRCWFDVFRKEGREIRFDPLRCAGCGLCVNTCPSGALHLTGRC